MAELAARPNADELLGRCLLRLDRPRDAIVPLAAATALSRHDRPPTLEIRELARRQLEG